MLTVINRYCHGYISVPVIVAFKRKFIFGTLKEKPLTFDDLVDILSANSGHLQVALKIMETLGWLLKDAKGYYQYSENADVSRFIPNDILDIFNFSLEDSLGIEKLNTWIERSIVGWGSGDEWYNDFIDGALMLPLLLGMHAQNMHYKEGGYINFLTVSEDLKNNISKLFKLKKWAYKFIDSRLYLTDSGKYLMDRILISGTVFSYRPMLLSMEQLLFGDSESVFSRDEYGHENHIDRTLNVVASGFQHAKYFRDVKDIVLSIFNREPLGDQPKYIADMGCGDGSLLKSVYELIRDESRRGKALEQYPLMVIGVDYNIKALEATKKTLEGIEHIVIEGDIGDPLKMEADLLKHIDDVENILHIRSFLDHDRPFIPPNNAIEEINRNHMPYEGVYVGANGVSVSANTAIQSLVEHLSLWGKIKSKYGIIALEVHCLSATAAGYYRDESENLHFDAYHAFSRQYLVEADIFIMAAAEVGLIADIGNCIRYPKVLPYSRITLNYFKKSPYNIRHALISDLPMLLSLEERCLSDHSQSAISEIQKRIEEYPLGQYILESNSNIIGALYTQIILSEQGNGNIVNCKAEKNCTYKEWRHDSKGDHVSFLYAVFLEGDGQDITNKFVGFSAYVSSLKDGIESVDKVSECEKFFQNSRNEKKHNDLNQYVFNYLKNHPMDPSEDTVTAEMELEEFGSKWLLKIFQDMGVFNEIDESYGVDELRDNLGVLPKYKKLFNSLLGILEKYQLISISSQEVKLKPKIERYALIDVEIELSYFRESYRSKHPKFIPFLELMSACLSDYASVLIGQKEATDVVFPDGSMKLFSGIFKGNKVADHFNALLAEIISKRVLNPIENKGTYRILEIGAGTGGATEFVLPVLGREANNISYYYTDISSSFTRYGEKRFSTDYPWVKFERLDIEKDTETQGFEQNSFDVIYASNVLHDTRYLLNTLDVVKKLLVDGGLLVLNEFTCMKDLLLYTGGLLHGWWLFEDPENRLKNSCLLGIEQWESAFKKSGFVNFHAYGLPFENDLNSFRQSVMFSEKRLTGKALKAEVGNDHYRDATLLKSGENEKNTEHAIGYRGSIVTIEGVLCEIIGQRRMKGFSKDTPLMEIGLDSIELVELRALLNKKLSLSLETSFFFQYNTSAKIASHIDKSLSNKKTKIEISHEVKVHQNRNSNAMVDSDTIPVIKKILHEITGSQRMQRFSIDSPLMEMGLDSIELVELRALLNKRLSIGLETTFFFQYNTVEKIAAFIEENHSENVNDKVISDVAGPISARKKPIHSKYNLKNDIAIIGVSLRFPGEIDSLADYWELIKDGKSAIDTVDSHRWEWPTEVARQKPYLKQGGFLPQIDAFDASFFKISPKEAELMDPQQRLLLELSWAAIEDGGYKASDLRGSETGVYIGACHFDYRELLEKNEIRDEAYISTGTNGAILANRLSYFYHFHGPSMLLDTACSSALVSIHEAVRGLRSGECTLALAGGVNLICTLTNTLLYDRAGILSKTGKCSTFDARANGYVRGEGGGLVLLKTMEDAIKDNDLIYGVIKGSAINHGGQASSLTAPNPEAQARLIRSALLDGKVSADTIGYIEAHGTGTALGDPIELEGLRQAFVGSSNHVLNNNNQYCALGSVKPNMGHLEGAAGIAGLLKALLSVRNKKIPTSCNYESLNPEINLDYENSPFYIPEKSIDWNKYEDDYGNAIPRRAGVSAFGFGGANAHLIIEEFNEKNDFKISGDIDSIFVFSSRTKEGLYENIKLQLDYIKNKSEGVRLSDICRTLQFCRESMAVKIAIPVSEKKPLIKSLEAFLSGDLNFDGVYHNLANVSEDIITRELGSEAKTRIVKKLFLERNFEQIAILWVSGFDVDWNQLYDNQSYDHVRLPVYQFSRQKFWVPDNKVKTDEAYVENDFFAIGFNNIMQNKRLDSDGYEFEFLLNGEEPFFADHVINFEKTLPATASFEMVKAIVSAVYGKKSIRFSDVVWISPFIFKDAPRGIKINLHENVDFIEYRLTGLVDQTDDMNLSVYGQGRIYVETEKTKNNTAKFNINDLVNEYDLEFSGEKCYELFKEKGIDHRGGFQTIQYLRCSSEEAFSYLKSSNVFKITQNQYERNIYLTDAALQTAVGFSIANGLLSEALVLLPYGIENIEVYGPLPDEVYVHTKFHGSQNVNSKLLKFDISVLDGLGNLVLDFYGLTMLSQQHNFSLKRNYSAADLDIVYATPQWREEGLQLQAGLNVDSSSEGQLILIESELLDLLGPLDEMLPKVTVKSLPHLSDDIGQNTENLFFDFMKHIRSWRLANSNNVDTKIIFVIKDTEDSYQYYPLIGLLNSLKIESPDIKGKIVAFTEALCRDKEKILVLLREEMAVFNYAVENVRYCIESGRMVNDLIEVPAGQKPEGPSVGNNIKPGGVYWITGGLGALGLIFAKYIGSIKDTVVVLSGRSPLNNIIETEINLLKSAFINVEYIQTDVSDPESIAKTIFYIKQKYQRLNGIIHGAGVLSDSFFLSKTPEGVSNVMAPKISGLVYIDELTCHEPLDFIAVFSSIVAVTGNIGQSDYSAANAFMDNYAAYRNQLISSGQRFGKMVSINWPLWASGGMQLSEKDAKSFLTRFGLMPMDTATGLKAFDWALNSEVSQVIVAVGRRDEIEQGLLFKRLEKSNNLKPELKRETNKVYLEKSTILYLKRILSDTLKLDVEKLDANAGLDQYGIDSLMALDLTEDLEKIFGPLSKTLFFEYQTIKLLANFFINKHETRLNEILGDAVKANVSLSSHNQVNNPILTGKVTENNRFRMGENKKEPIIKNDISNQIAIIGMSGRYPQADNLNAYWENLKSGKDCVTEIPKSRWDYEPGYDADQSKPGKVYSKWGGFIEDYDKFDPGFFNISPREAEFMDPQERLFLEVVWETLEDAGYTRDALQRNSTDKSTRSDVGVYVGVMYSEYQLYGAEQSMNGNHIALSGNTASIANRISYFCDFNGPSIAIDTMCSSSLTAIHLACESLISGQCNVAIAGGVNLTVHPNKYTMLSQGKFASSNGRCVSFGEGGDGYVPGEGVGAVLLKPLKQAIADGDHIHCVIKGTSINHGGKTNGYTVPNPNAQADVIAQTLNRANVSAREVSYIEAHGTGTSLGDPIEISGLIKAFNQNNDNGQYCAIGSVKSNIGHCESAAGIAGITKVVLQMRHQQLVPSLHSSTLNPHIVLDNTPFKVQQELSDWSRLLVGGKECKRVAGVSSFGAGGANAHVILEEYTADHSQRNITERRHELIPLSANNEESLKVYAQKILDFLKPLSLSVDFDHADVSLLLLEDIKIIIAKVLGVLPEDIDCDVLFHEYGIEKIDLINMVSTLETLLNVEIDKNVIFYCESINGISDCVFTSHKSALIIHYQNNSISRKVKKSDLSTINSISSEIVLQDMAYSLQLGREPMSYRVVFVVDSEASLLEKLNQFICNETTIEKCYQGNVKRKSATIELFSNDEDFQSTVELWAKKRKLDQLAELWCGGFDIDWELLHIDRTSKRMSLPTYPFLKQRYWFPIKNKENITNSLKENIDNYLHPLVHKNSSDFLEQKFDSEFHGDEFYFADHIVGGVKILPGVACLEMALIAGNLSKREEKVTRIKDISWMVPLTIKSDPLHVATIIQVEGDIFEYAVVSSDSNKKRISHACGTLVFGSDVISDSENYNIEELKYGLKSMLSKQFIYESFERLGFSYGPGFQVIDKIYYNETKALSVLSLPQNIKLGNNRYILHPGLMDGVFQSVFALLENDISKINNSYVPCSVDEINIFRPLTDNIFVHVSRSGQESNNNIKLFDLQIIDQEGFVAVEIKNLFFRVMMTTDIDRMVKNKERSVIPVSMNYYTPFWRKQALVERQKILVSKTILLFDVDRRLKGFIDEKFQKNEFKDAIVILVKPGPQFLHSSDEIYQIRAEEQNDYFKLADELIKKNIYPDSVIYNWSNKVSCFEIKANLAKDLYFLSYMVKAFIHKFSHMSIHYVFENSVAVPTPHYSATAELLKTVYLESSKYSGSSIELFSSGNSSEENYESFMGNVYQECLFGKDAGLEIKYNEKNERFVKHYNALDEGDFVSSMNNSRSLLKSGGLYLITGGAGGIGIIFAKYLCQKYKATVILVGRSDLSDGKIKQISTAQEEGGDINYIKCDIVSYKDVDNLIKEVKQKYGSINGIIHSAGVANVALVEKKKPINTHSIVAPKLYGVLNLDLATRSEDVDFFAMFSSISAVTGDGGLSDYAYANGFMDRFADTRHVLVERGIRKGKTVSINWPVWKEGGMTTDFQTEALMKNVQGIYPMDTADGLEAFENVLQSSFSQFAVMPGIRKKIDRTLDLRVHQNISQHSKASDSISIGDNTSEYIIKKLKGFICSILKIEADSIDLDTEFDDYGFDSVTLTEFANEINSIWDVAITPTVFYEYHTLNELSQHLRTNYSLDIFGLDDSVSYGSGDHTHSGDDAIFYQSNDHSHSGYEPPSIESKKDEMHKRFQILDTVKPEQVTEAIAIIGMDGILPGSSDLEAFWEHLEQGHNLISEIPASRWDWRQYFGDPNTESGKTNSKWGGFIDDVDQFDPQFFNISPAEAEVMDPQHRLFMQVVWRCIEDAGYAASELSGRAVGVYVGAQFQDYQELISRSGEQLNAHAATGNAHSMLPNRISYFLNLTGPSEAIDTACSSSLVAIHRAVRSIQSGEIECAIAGGVSLALSPLTHLLASQMGALSPQGQCKTFDKDANGYVKGEGVGAILLKPLGKAIEDGDSIYAVIKGSAENHGGKAKSLTAPSPSAQAKLLISAYEQAGINPQTVGYIETHGTGTELGDPIEIEGLKKAFSQLYAKYDLLPANKPHCALGAVKTNIGHLEPAAGIAGVLKVLLAMKHRKIPGVVNFNKLNPYIKLKSSPFYLATECQEWEKLSDENGHLLPYRAGVSSFGFGGANAHIILEAHETSKDGIVASNKRKKYLIVLSAKTQKSLNDIVINFRNFISSNAISDKNQDLSSIAYTLQVGRNQMPHRIAFVVGSITELLNTLDMSLNGTIDTDSIFKGYSKESSIYNAGFSLHDNELQALAKAWVEGAEVDWGLYYKGEVQQRLHIPGYVFDKQRYWVSLQDQDNNSLVIQHDSERNHVEITERVKTKKYGIDTDNQISYWNFVWDKNNKKNLFANIEKVPECILIFSENSQLYEELLSGIGKEKLKSCFIFLVEVSDRFEPLSETHYKIRANVQQDYEDVMGFLASINKYPELSIFDLKKIKFNKKYSTNSNMYHVLEVSTYFYQSCVKLKVSGMSMIYLYHRKQNQYQPQYSAISGFIKSLKAENENFKGKLIELIEEGLANNDKTGLILNEYMHMEEVDVRYKNNERYIKIAKAVEVMKGLDNEENMLREQGVYLITGGTGAIGLIFAQYLAESIQAKIILVGRSAASANINRQIEKIESYGSKVEFIQCDISVRKEVQQLIKDITQDYKIINGIFHCAGLTRDSLVRNKKKQQLDEVMAAKVNGTMYLDEATQSIELDFFLFCSSLSAITGNLGQAAYAYANGFMDAYTEMRNHLSKIGVRNGVAISINWPYWQTGGMSIDSDLLPDLLQTQGYPPLSNEQALKILDFSLYGRISNFFPRVHPAEADSEFESNQAAAFDAKGELLDFDASVLSEKTAQFLNDIFYGVLKIELKKGQSFEEAGVDSFLSIKIIGLLEKQFGPLRKTLLYEFFNIEKLTQYFIENYQSILINEFHINEKPGLDNDCLEVSCESNSNVISAAKLFLGELFSQKLKIDIDFDQSFEESGVDSFMSLKIVKDLEEIFGTLPKTLLYEYYNFDKLVEFFVNNHNESLLSVINIDYKVLSNEVVRLSQEVVETDKKLGLSNGCFDVDLSRVNVVSNDAGVNDELISKYANECTVSIASFYMAPDLFCVKGIDALFHVYTDSKILVVFGYTGSNDFFNVMLRYAQKYCIDKSIQLNVLTEEKITEVDGVNYTATSFGVMQRIMNLENYVLEGGKYRRLRNMISKFLRKGKCSVEEYRFGTNPDKDKGVLKTIDEWSSKKEYVNPYIYKFRQSLVDKGCGEPHRLFITYLNGSIQNVILITKTAGGYFMDLEFYLNSMPYGGLEYAITEIINKLKAEGCHCYSLGATFGVEIGDADNADLQVLNSLRELHTINSAGKGNFQFKNKFVTENKVLYLCKPIEGRVEDVADIYMIIAGMHIEANSESNFEINSDVYKGYKKWNFDLEEYGFNPTMIPSEKIDYDLMTDSWTQLKAREFVKKRLRELNDSLANGGAKNTVDLVEGLQSIFPFSYIMPVVSGRVAESVLCGSWSKAKKIVVGNLLFPTWIFTQIENGYSPIEFPDEAVFDLKSNELFKGNLNLQKLNAFLEQSFADVAFICVELNNNAAGGYSISIDNLRKIKSLAKKYSIPLVLDATRILENAVTVIREEPDYSGWDLWQVVKKICSYADCITASLGKDFNIGIGGFIGTNNADIANHCKVLIDSESDQLNVSDRKLMISGLIEKDYIKQRVYQRMDNVQEIWSSLVKESIPVVHPCGGHCVLIDVDRLPEFDRMKTSLPSFLAWLYCETGIRAGIHSAGMQKNSVLNNLIRIAIPVGMSREDIDMVSSRLIDLFKRKDSIFELESVSTMSEGFGNLNTKYRIVDWGKPINKKTNNECSHDNKCVDTRLSGGGKAGLSEKDVAIIGVAGRYPMAENISEFWNNLMEAKDCVSEVPFDRWNEADVHGNRGKTKFGGYIDNVDKFDPLFFNISPQEAKSMDPQERLFLQTAWKALEDAGYFPESLIDKLGSNNIGVYVGVVWSHYQVIAAEESRKGNWVKANPFHFSVANRVSYFMNFTGPSFALDSACSSSLLALHLACEAIKSGEAKAAIVGGVNLDIHPSKHIGLAADNMLSASGRCRSFSDAADGYVPGEGVGAVLLKSLSQAIKDEDHIYAVVKATSANHAGKTSGYSIPNPDAQADLIRRSLEKAEVEPMSVGCIEAHGTGTQLGDSIEILSLNKAFGGDGENKYCSIGTVKSNIGHLEAAAGIASLTKVILQIQHRKLLPSLHSTGLSKTAELKDTPFYIQQEYADWKPIEKSDKGVLPLRAGINGFGAGGANAHAIVEEYIYADKHTTSPPDINKTLPAIVPISARNNESLVEYANQLLQFINNDSFTNVLDMAYTLQVGRKPMQHRAVFCVSNMHDLLEKLKAMVSGERDLENCFFGIEEKCSEVNHSTFQSGMLSELSAEDLISTLASMWVKGITVDWEIIYKTFKLKPRRISLPTYCFSKERYWIDLSNNVSSEAINDSAAQGVGFDNERFNNSRDGLSSSYVAPNNEIEVSIAQIWAETLNIDNAIVGVDDNFFEFGGNSLYLSSVSNSIRDKYDVEIDLAVLFSASTVAMMAQKTLDLKEGQQLIFSEVEPVDKGSHIVEF